MPDLADGCFKQQDCSVYREGEKKTQTNLNLEDRFSIKSTHKGLVLKMAVSGLWNEGLLWEGSSCRNCSKSYVYTLWIYYWDAQGGLAFGWREKVMNIQWSYWALKMIEKHSHRNGGDRCCYYTELDKPMHALLCHNCALNRHELRALIPSGQKGLISQKLFQGWYL